MEDIDEMQPATIYRFFSGLQAVISGLYVSQVHKKDGPHLVTTQMFDNPHDNPRIQCLLKVITDEKTIIFCKYTHEIESIIEVLKEKYGEESCVGFYGDINQKQRQKNLYTFEDNDNCKYLVANKGCAGYGLNLQFCHNLIYYSNDWTLGTRLQSEDRLHRIGQEQDVNIIDIVAWGTLDERILRCLRKKTSLLDDIKNSLKDKNTMRVPLMELMGRKKINTLDVIEENKEEDDTDGTESV